MVDALLHRGPDGGGSWADPDAGIALGHRRLAIVDLSPEGRQPMPSPSGRWVVTFNGEIYNHRALRAALTAEGAPVRGASDTAVLLAAVDAWGVERALPRLAGMFALALWDRAERTLHLVRDRVGEKPLYYGVIGGALVFGSELKALRRAPGWTGTVDRAALVRYMQLGYVPAPSSIYVGVHKLPAGCRAVARAAEPGAVEVTAYWSAAAAAAAGRARPDPGDATEVAERLDTLLRDVVRDEMVADVPLGAFLSGGVDSSLVAALMQAQSTRPVRTFTIGFADRRFDEAPHALAVARHLGTDHTAHVVTPAELLRVVPRLPTLFDEPFADSSQVPTHLLAGVARRAVTVSLSGDGGDEVFGGYNRHLWGARLWRGLTRVPRPARRLAAGAVAAVPPRGYDALYDVVEGVLPRRLRVGAPGPGARLHKLAGLLTADGPHELYERLTSQWADPTALVLGAPDPAPVSLRDDDGAGLDPVARMMLADLQRYLPDDVLVKVDRAAMGVSLETRAPLLDHRVVEFAWGLPVDLKVRDGEGKWILRRVLDRYVPRRLIERPKAGFAVPLAAWLRGPLAEWAADLLDPARLRADGYLDPRPVCARWVEHRRGARDWDGPLWTVLMFQAWLHHTD